jgi:SAM-dependent methyltransferase
MDTGIRKPLQGLYNIIRFNWHFYAFSAAAVITIILIQRYFLLPGLTAYILALLIIFPTIISLAVSAYVYDFSGFYQLSWLNGLESEKGERMINIHAGFDETSSLLQRKFADSHLLVADFYDPARHTEISIKRARKAYPPFPNTQQVSTTHLNIQDKTLDKAFTILSAHEIRDEEERIKFFRELHRVLKPAGKLIVTEHLRDTANFLAYNLGAFHFHSKATWLKTFRNAGFEVFQEIKTTAFITTFILRKNGTAS